MYSFKKGDTAVELLVQTIQEKLSSVYCDTCRHYSDEATCDDSCSICNRNKMRWGISYETAAELAHSLLDTVQEKKWE
jgi:hypothetical protein